MLFSGEGGEFSLAQGNDLPMNVYILLLDESAKDSTNSDA
jgi:hypothetical protein